MKMRAVIAPAIALLLVPLYVACGDRKPATTAKAATTATGAATETAAPTGPKTDTVTGDAPPPPPAPGQSSKLVGSARASYDSGVGLYNAGDLPGAATQFQNAIGAEPKAYEAYYALGVTYERMGKNADALEAYRNAYKLNPNYDAAIAAYGFLLYRQGSRTEAENFLSDQSAKNPKALGVMTALAEIKSLSGDSNSAQTLAGNVLTVEAKYEPAMVLIARDHYRRGRVDLATYVLSAILDGQKTTEEKEKGLTAKTNPPRAPNNAEAHMLRAIILQKMGERLPAAKWFESAAKLRPDLVDAQLQVGLIRLEANDAEGALEPLRRAVQYNSGSVEAHLALGDAYRLGTKPAEAKKEYQWVIAATGAPANLKALAQYNMGLLYFLTPGIDGLSDVQRYDKSVEFWNQYKSAKGTAAGPSWPQDVEDLMEQARRARLAAEAAGKGGGGTAPKPATTAPPATTPAKPAASAPAATSAAPAASPAKPAASPAPTASAPAPAASPKGGVKATF